MHALDEREGQEIVGRRHDDEEEIERAEVLEPGLTRQDGVRRDEAGGAEDAEEVSAFVAAG